MNKRTRQIVAATVTLLILVILQSISIPTENGSVHSWQPGAKKGTADALLVPARERYAHGNDDLRARPTR